MSQNITTSLHTLIAMLAKSRSFNTMEQIEIDRVLRVFDKDAAAGVRLALEFTQYIEDNFNPIQAFRDKDLIETQKAETKPRVATDADGFTIAVGSIVFCCYTSEQEDPEFDLEVGKTYTVASIHHTDNLSAPMIQLVDSTCGPVFSDRFRLL